MGGCIAKGGSDALVFMLTVTAQDCGGEGGLAVAEASIAGAYLAVLEDGETSLF